MVIDSLFSGKIRVALLTKLFLNPASTVYLRGLERDLGVSSNTVRLELNKLNQMQLIQVIDTSSNNKLKEYIVNQTHPLFETLRAIILKFVGLDQIINQIIKKLGSLNQVYLTGDLALGKNSPFIDLVVVGEIEKEYLYQLIEKVEPIVNKKIRVGIYKNDEFSKKLLDEIGVFMKM